MSRSTSRANLKIPVQLKQALKVRAAEKGIYLSTYVTQILGKEVGYETKTN